MRTVEWIDIRPENILHLYKLKSQKGSFFFYSLTKNPITNVVVDSSFHGTFDITAYSSKKKWSDIYDVSRNFNHGIRFKIPLLVKD